MTRIIPTAALIALAGPALAHPGHADGPAHWLALDHLAMLGAMVAIAGGRCSGATGRGCVSATTRIEGATPNLLQDLWANVAAWPFCRNILHKNDAGRWHPPKVADQVEFRNEFWPATPGRLDRFKKKKGEHEAPPGSLIRL
ncbi:hypothetical protein [Roseicyclus elongatus]|uniref:hypothetical protein n=1 Tax=Roseicyclus elongatus TaxID=159346 RepID=UPI00046D7FD8|nr:hypothetical protein [Roseibacterium elongatum]